jgi:HlyD family secretion protein
MRRRRRTLVIVAAAAAVLAAVALALRPAPVPAETARVERGPLEVVVEGTGRTRVRERFLVLAPVSGDLARISLEAGDPVAAGSVVARVAPLTPPPLDVRTRAELSARAAAAQAAAGEARAALERARIAAAEAKQERDRVRQLGAEGAVARREMEAAEFAARAAAEEVSAAESARRRAQREVEAARAALRGFEGKAEGGTIPVVSPASGKVLRVLRESAGPVSAGTPLLEIGDPDRLEAVVDLLTLDAVRVRPGARARLTGWGGGDPLDARVLRVEPSGYTKVSPLGVEEQRVNVVVVPGDAPGWDALGDGYAAEIAIVVEELDDAVKVPSSALFQSGDAWAVFAVEDGVARRRRVEVAARAGRELAVVSGVAPGDRVVLHPSDRIRDGSRLELE